eukprot:5456340-Pyramimonas_sp.AAC.1
MSGCTADRKKIFDLLEYEIGDKLMEALGCPTGVLRASQEFYANLKTRWKVAQAVGAEKTRNNGYVQGDS